MIYNQLWFTPHEACKRQTTREYLQTQGAKHKESTTKTEKKKKTRLQVDTHTKKRVFPPIMIIVTKGRLFWFQP